MSRVSFTAHRASGGRRLGPVRAPRRASSEAEFCQVLAFVSSLSRGVTIGGTKSSPAAYAQPRLEPKQSATLEDRMKILIAIVVTSGTVHADDRAACRPGCNGNGACLRACDLTTCRQACGGSGTCLQACQPSDCRLGCYGSGACLQDCGARDRGLINR
jgi:hypothetical protein